MAICGYAGCEVVELNIQPDHVHLVVMVPPKLSISDFVGRLKGQTSMKLFSSFST
jgi:putative transposase